MGMGKLTYKAGTRNMNAKKNVLSSLLVIAVNCQQPNIIFYY